MSMQHHSLKGIAYLMIETKFGNLLTNVTSGIILHQVNAQGVMGGGIAGQIRKKWPRVFVDYSSVVQRLPGVDTADYLGRIIVSWVDKDLVVISIVGQQFYGNDGRMYTSYKALEEGLSKIMPLFGPNGSLQYLSSPTQVHFPKFGCGLGGADWSVVQSLIETHLPDLKKTLWIYE